VILDRYVCLIFMQDVHVHNLVSNCTVILLDKKVMEITCMFMCIRLKCSSFMNVILKFSYANIMVIFAKVKSLTIDDCYII